MCIYWLNHFNQDATQNTAENKVLNLQPWNILVTIQNDWFESTSIGNFKFPQVLMNWENSTLMTLHFLSSDYGVLAKIWRERKYSQAYLMDFA